MDGLMPDVSYEDYMANTRAQMAHDRAAEHLERKAAKERALRQARAAAERQWTDEIVGYLLALAVPGTDQEHAHIEHDRILLQVVKALAPRVAEASETVRETVEFWYA